MHMQLLPCFCKKKKLTLIAVQHTYICSSVDKLIISFKSTEKYWYVSILNLDGKSSVLGHSEIAIQNSIIL